MYLRGSRAREYYSRIHLDILNVCGALAPPMWRLWRVIAALAIHSKIGEAKARAVFFDAIEVGGTIDRAVRIAVISHRESRWDPNVVNPKSGTCGATQLSPIWWQGHTCAEIRHDRRLAFKLGLDAIDVLTVQCGSLERALVAFAHGQCGPMTPLVRAQCAMGEGC